MWLYMQGAEFILGNSLFGTAKLTENSHPDEYSYSGYGIGFDARGRFSLSDCCGFGKKVIIFGADTSSSVHIDNKKKEIFIPGKGPIDALDNTMLAAGRDYFINFIEQQKKS